MMAFFLHLFTVLAKYFNDEGAMLLLKFIGMQTYNR